MLESVHQNVQAHSDANLSCKNMEETKLLFLWVMGHCASNHNNVLPIQLQPSHLNPIISIPKSTPFALTLTATHPEGRHHHICFWDQMNGYSNPAQTMPPASTNTKDQYFRNIMPTVSPTRYFLIWLLFDTGSTSNTWKFPLEERWVSRGKEILQVLWDAIQNKFHLRRRWLQRDHL